MKKVLLLATGGTIASRPGESGLEPERAPAELLRAVGELEPWYDVTYRGILNLDSSNIQAEEWQLIARSVYDALEDYDGIVVTHGTDTMAYTASVLSFMLQNLQKPVVLTGSQLPVGTPLSDARSNLATALDAVDSDVRGVSIGGGAAAIRRIDGVDVGVMGQVHPLVAAIYGIDADVYCAEIDFTKLFDMQLPDATYTPLPKYPTVSRDLSLICSEDVTVAQAEAVITAAAGKLLRDVKLFDIYRGPGVPEGKKSMAFSLELRADDRTLTDTDSEAVVTKVLAALKEKLDAALR